MYLSVKGFVILLVKHNIIGGVLVEGGAMGYLSS